MRQNRIYEIRIEGQLTDRWTDWFEGLEIFNAAQNETILRGAFVDQAALFGVLARIQALNLVLISVNRMMETPA